MKICTKCGIEKELNKYFACKKHADGKQSECKECHKKMSRVWQMANPEMCHQYDHLWKKANAKRIKEQAGIRYKVNPEKYREKSHHWQEANIEKSRKSRRESEAKKRGTLKGKLNNAMTCGMRASLRTNKGGRHWEDLVSFTVDQLKIHLEKLFKPGMTWENYGTYWQIDHKVPIAVFNFDKPEQIDFRLCWSLKNLQPLEAKENIRKGARIEKSFQPSLAIGTKQIHQELLKREVEKSCGMQELQRPIRLPLLRDVAI